MGLGVGRTLRHRGRPHLPHLNGSYVGHGQEARFLKKSRLSQFVDIYLSVFVVYLNKHHNKENVNLHIGLTNL